MQSRWNVQGAQRRRRILIDEASAPDADQPKQKRRSAKQSADPQKEHARRSYEPFALEGQPRITDLIPQKRWMIALLMFLWLLLIAGIVYLHTQLDRWSEFVSRAALAPIDLGGAAGVATWFSSATLLLAAVGSWQVYNVRRHKTDDYRGTYRLWFWTAAWLVFGSLELTAGLRVTVQEFCVRYSGSQLAGGGDLWWMLVFGVPSVMLAVRLTFEMWKCKTAVTYIAAALIAYGYAAVFQLGYVPLDIELAVVHLWTAVMTAHFFVLATVAVYARHVLIDAQGHVAGAGKAKRQNQRRSQQTVSKSGTASESAKTTNSKQPAKAVSKATKKAASKKKAESDSAASETESLTRQSSVSSKEGAESSQHPTSANPRAGQTSKKVAKQGNSADNQQLSRRKSKRQKHRDQAAKSRQQQEQQQAANKTTKGTPSATQKSNKNESAANQSKPKLAEPTPDFTEIEDGQQESQQLSKAQRRKLRKQRRNEARRAA